MKRWIVLFTGGLVLPLMLATSVSALEVGNIKFFKGKGRMTVELQAEHFTRQMDLKEPCNITSAPVYIEPITSAAVSFYLPALQEVETVDRYFLKTSFNISLLEVYAKYGIGRLISKWEHYNLEVGFYETEGQPRPVLTKKIGIESPLELGLERSNWGTFYGAGLKLTFFSRPEFKISLDAQYAVQKNKDMGFLSYSTTWVVDGVEHELGYTMKIDETETKEMHVAIILSGVMGKLSPYGGIKYSQMETKYNGRLFQWERHTTEGPPPYEELHLSSFEYTMRQTDNLGFFFGADYHFTRRLIGNFEIRLLDETALSVGLGINV